MGDWSQLPSDLLEQITKRITLLDMIRVGYACTSWRLSSIPAHHKGQLPWLILPFEGNSEEQGNTWLSSLGFFSILDGITHDIHVPELIDRRICGSSNGWLVTIHDNADIHLIHPFSRKFIELPSFFEMPGVHGMQFINGEFHFLISDFTNPNRDHTYLESAVIIRDNYIKKAIVSSAVVMGILSGSGILSEQRCLFFCKHGDSKWQVIRDDKRYSDVIHYQGQFYAISNSGVVVVIDGLECSRPVTQTILQEGYCGESGCWYLVESSGSLLKVVQSQVHKKIGFKIWKLDFGKWLEVKNLGDRALFLGSNNSCSVSVADFPGCKGNCIYFSGDLWKKSYQLGIYNLEDFTFDTLHPNVPPFTFPQPIWYASMSM